MKKTLFTAIILMYTMIGFAQIQENINTSQHLTFKGVPINGTLNEYVSKMTKSGFTHEGTEKGVAILTGDFAAYKNCIVAVATLKQRDLVNKITVIFPESDTWSTLSSNYYNLKGLLTEKYGEPADIVEKFDSRIEPKDDNSKMYDVRFDNCKYFTTYKTEKGSIQLAIDHDSSLKCFVRLSYSDKINGDKIRQEALKDL